MSLVDIHPSAVIHPNAKIGEGCVIGPYCMLGENVSLGSGSFLHSHIVIDGYTHIGKNAKIYPYSSIGLHSQDLKYKKGNKTYTKIGDNVIIRELVTIHSGTDDETGTEIGDSCVFLTLSHVGHNCSLGNNIIVSHSAGLAGHVKVGDYANIGAKAGVHQHCTIGSVVLIGAMTKVTQDILPFCTVEGNPCSMKFINKIGMERAGYSSKEVNLAMAVYRIIFMQSLRLKESKKEILKLGENRIVNEIINFLSKNTRGLVRV